MSAVWADDDEPHRSYLILRKRLATYYAKNSPAKTNFIVLQQQRPVLQHERNNVETNYLCHWRKRLHLPPMFVEFWSSQESIL